MRRGFLLPPSTFLHPVVQVDGIMEEVQANYLFGLGDTMSHNEKFETQVFLACQSLQRDKTLLNRHLFDCIAGPDQRL